MEHKLEDIIAIFNQCFEEEYNTRLVKGGDEPIYIPEMMRCLIMRFTLREAFTAVHYMKLLIGWWRGKSVVN